jgi:heme-degrading monooxygenase HmoA
MFRVVLRLRIHAGQEEEFERVWAANTAAVADHPANLGQFLARSADSESTYYIGSDWVDEPGFREFENSREHVEHRQKLHPYRSHGSIRMMRAVPGLVG